MYKPQLAFNEKIHAHFLCRQWCDNNMNTIHDYDNKSIIG